jgi:hypothetical protein
LSRNPIGLDGVLSACYALIGAALLGVTFVLLARRVSNAEAALFIATYSIGVTASAFLDFGGTQAVNRDVALNRDGSWVPGWVLRRVGLHGLVVAIPVACAAIGLRQLQPMLVTALLLLQGPFICAAYGAIAPIRVLRGARFATRYQAIGNLAPLLSIVLLGNKVSLTWLAAGFLCSWLATAGLALRTAKRFRRLESDPNISLAGSMSLGIYGLAVAAAGLDLPLFAGVAGASKAAALAVVARWMSPLGALTHGYVQAVFPSLVSASDTRSALRLLRTAWLTMTILAIFCFLLFAFAPLVVSLTLGDRYSGSVGVLRMLAIGAISSAGVGIAFGFLQARKMEGPLTTPFVVMTGCHLVTVAAGARVFDARLVPISFGVWQAAFLALCCWVVRVDLKSKD